MTQLYQMTANPDVILRRLDHAFIPNDGGNRDWQAFQAWLAEGNTPDPAPDPPRVVLPQPTALEADPQRDMDAVTRRYLDQRIADLKQGSS